MSHQINKVLLAALLGAGLFAAQGAVASTIATTVVADSVADFSGVQGQGSWFYGYENGLIDNYSSSGFQQLANYVTTSVWDGSKVWSYLSPFPNGGQNWTALSSIGGHPTGTNNGSGVQLAVRRWESEVSGLITISGTFQNFDGGNVTGGIYVNGVQLWNGASSGNLASNYSLATTVAQGDKIDFVLSSNGVDYNDSTRFSAQITAAVPEPETYALFLAGLGLIGAITRRKKG